MTDSIRPRRIPKSVIGRECVGIELIDWLTKRFTYRARESWLEELASGRITVNARLASPGILLAYGDEVVWTPVLRPEPEVNFDCAVVYEDDQIIAVNKPGNLPCHPAGVYFIIL